MRCSPAWKLLFLILTIACKIETQEKCFEFDFPGFNVSNERDLSRDNSYIALGAIQVTPDVRGGSIANQAGRALYNKPFRLWSKDKNATFNTTFVINISNQTDPGGEGLAFDLCILFADLEHVPLNWGIESELHFMVLNPQLLPNGMPIPFVNEMFVLVRDGVEFEVDKIPRGHGGHVKAKGVIYLSNIRLFFVASKPVENFVAFDMPLLYIHAEKFNQPIFHCNNISGQVEPAAEAAAAARRVDPLQAAQTPVDEMMRHAYVDPNDPTRIYLQQPSGESQLRRRAYHSGAAEH